MFSTTLCSNYRQGSRKNNHILNTFIMKINKVKTVWFSLYNTESVAVLFKLSTTLCPCPRTGRHQTHRSVQQLTGELRMTRNNRKLCACVCVRACFYWMVGTKWITSFQRKFRATYVVVLHSYGKCGFASAISPLSLNHAHTDVCLV